MNNESVTAKEIKRGTLDKYKEMKLKLLKKVIKECFLIKTSTLYDVY